MNQPKAPSPITRRLPGRLTVAWAVLGAAAAVALMYHPFVYRATCYDSPVFSGPPWHGRVRMLGVYVYYEHSQIPGEVRKAVDAWHRGVTASLAAVGGLVGALVGWREQRRLRQSGVAARRGGWLWLAATAAVFVLLGVVGIPGESAWTLWYQVRWQMDLPAIYGGVSWKYPRNIPWGELARLTFIAFAVGCAAHVAAGARGVRFAVGRRPDQAADYSEDMVAGEGR